MFQASPGTVLATLANVYRMHCYTTRHGIQVAQFATECPNVALVEHLTAGALDRIGAKDKQMLRGLRLIFVPHVIICGPPQNDLITLGCTLADGSKSFVFLAGGIATWGRVTAHEFGHAILVLSGKDGDGGHEDRDFWDAIERIDVKEFE